jgi:glutathione S-transferase
MTLRLYCHPLSSFCQKVLVALYENGTPFTPELVDFGNATSREGFLKTWPIGQFPVLRDEAHDRLVPESSVIIEYLDRHYPGPTKFLPADPDLARQARFRERFFDLHVQQNMQKVVTDRIRPAGQHDPFGVEQARAKLKTALDMIEGDVGEAWAMGEDFGVVDCAAAPALWYADKVIALEGAHPKTARYLQRLSARPSFARALKEAEPYLKNFPRG